MDVKTNNVALAITIDLSAPEFDLLSAAAARDGLSLAELLKCEILSSCQGVKTPQEKQPIPA